MPHTQPFELPDFYLPWPARTNPHVDGARVHTKLWAREVGILDTPPGDATPQIWCEAKFDSMDIGLFCALSHPDALPTDLELITDWIVWAFYFDDLFLEVFKRRGNAGGLRAQVARLTACMPLDAAAPTPGPANALERGLLDLWERTVPSHSVHWRRRFHASTTDMLDVVNWELRNISAGRVANPIEFVQWRRPAGGALWTAYFVEHANLAEVPDRVWAQRPLRVLRDTFADAVHYRNDLFSYEREVHEEGELSNFVLVLEQFFGVGPQAAAETVNDLLNSRLHQFEHTTVTEVPVMFEEHLLTAPERAAVALFVKGLQDWQAGCHEWHLRSSRYTPPAKRTQPRPAVHGAPSGLGTAAARPFTPSPESVGLTRFRAYAHVPYEQVGPIAMPGFYMPYRSTRINPHYARARDATVDWAGAMGMLEPVPGLLGSGIWTDDLLRSFDFCHMTARWSPDAAEPAFVLASTWIVWGLYFDDYFQRIYGATRDMATAKAFHARLALFLPLDGEPVPPPVNPLERGLVDLWPRTAPRMSSGDRQTFREILQTTFGSWLWELENQIQNRIPDPIDFIEMRRWTVAAELVRSCARLGQLARLPPKLAAVPAILELDNAAADYLALQNDIVSYQAEIQYEGSPNNMVLVAQSFLGIALEQAVHVVNDLITRRLEQFEWIAATELSRVARELELDDAARAGLDGRGTYAASRVLHAPKADGHEVVRSEEAAPADRAVRTPEAGCMEGDQSPPAVPQALPEPTPRVSLPAHGEPMPDGARAARRRSARPTVAVFGAGVAGMTAAHELAERGFDVSLYERHDWGGKARSTEVAGSERGGRRPLPGEHGLRAEFGFYQNLVDTMRRIPFGSNPNGVFDNLVEAPQFGIAREGRRSLVLPIGPSDAIVRTPRQVLDLLEATLVEAQVPPDGAAYFAKRMLVFSSSCDARRSGEWEAISWSDFIGADRFSDDYRAIFSDSTFLIQAASAERSSATFNAWFVELALQSMLGRGSNGPMTRVLNLPTSDAWIRPWVAELRRLGVRLQRHHELTALEASGGRLTGADIQTPNGPRSITPDWYVCALPVERARALWTGAILAVDPDLARMHALQTAQTLGIQFYLRDEPQIARGGTLCADSPWKLACIAQAQFWNVDFASTFGDGRARDCLSAAIGDCTSAGIVYGKPATECTAEELAREAWEQITSHVNTAGRPPRLTDDMVLGWALSDTPVDANGRWTADQPVIIAPVGTARHRPNGVRAIPNLVLAGDYLDGAWQVGTMEAASYYGRLAANAVLAGAGSPEPPARTIEPYSPPEFQALKQLDADRYARGEPNLFDIDGPLPPDLADLYEPASPPVEVARRTECRTPIRT